VRGIAEGEIAIDRQYDEDCKRSEALMALITGVVAHQHRNEDDS